MKNAFGSIVSTLAARDGFTVPPGNQPPRTLDHVLAILFSAESVQLVKEGGTAELLSRIIKWIYFQTMEVGDDEWIINALVEEYFATNNIVVGLNRGALLGTRGHSVIRYAKKVATNSFLTKFKKRQEHNWGFRLDFNAKLTGGGSFPDDSGRWKAHDLNPYLSNWMKIRMCRTGGSLFLTRHTVDVDPIERIREKIFGLVKECSTSGIDGNDLIRMTTNIVNHFGNDDRTGNVCAVNVRHELLGNQSESIFNMANMDEHALLDEAMMMGGQYGRYWP